MAKEQAVLEIVVDESDLLASATKSKTALVDLKEEQKELNTEFKKGTIDSKEFAKQSVILEQRIKREADTYKNLTKAINTNANSLDGMRLKLGQLSRERASLDRSNEKQIKDYDRLTKEINELNRAISKEEQKVGQFSRNVGNYGAKFQEAAQHINVAGVSLGSLTQQISSFVNPATAAVALVGALGAAYARSTIGAKDLAFAQSQLSFATTLATNSFASLISSAEDGEGIISQLTSVAIGSVFGRNTLILSKLLALEQEKLEDLEREEIAIRDKVNQRLEENQELLTELQSEQLSYNDKIGITNRIITNLRDNESELLKILNSELLILENQLNIDKENEAIQTAVLEQKREISNVERDTEKRVQAILRQEQNLTEEYKKQHDILGFNARRTGRTGNLGEVQPRTGADFLQDDPGSIKFSAYTKAEADMTAFQETEEIKRRKARQREIDAEQILFEQRINNTQKFIQTVAGIFSEESIAYQALASTQALIDTYRGATAALAPPPVGAGPLFGPLLAAATVAAGLANVARINGLEFAEGGWTGPGKKYDVAGVVHKDEYVAPKTVINNPMAKPHLQALERMRTGYADGGFVTSENTAPSQQTAIMLNAIRNLPPAEVSVKEITKVQNRIQTRETAASLKP